MMKFIQLLILSSVLSFTTCFAEPININKANAQEIADNLKGVGIKKAESIVEYREQHGEFKNIEQLLNVQGIGPKTLSQNEESLQLK